MSEERCPRCGSENVRIANFRLADYPSRTIYCCDCKRATDEWPSDLRNKHAALSAHETKEG